MLDHRSSKSYRPAGPEGPDAIGDTAREGPGRSAISGDLGFVDRLELGGSPNPSMLRYPGSQDYCGFEAPTLGEAEDRRLDGLLTPSRSESRHDRVTIDWHLDARVHAGTGSAERGPHRRSPGDRGDRVESASGIGSDEAAPHPEGPASRLKGPRVPGYEILEELGRGGMGVVYKARQIRLNRLVALKMILAGEYAGTEAVERFMAEAEIVARLQHPNIVRIHAIGDFEGRPYVELEYVEGGSLGSRLVGTPWPPRSAARLVESLAWAMAEAHRMGIVHRDLKPANILMTDDGTPKITDFGLAKSIDKDSGLTRTQSILGSPSYMAPEQAEGRAKDVGPTADVYALGANLYELLTGRPPFVGPTILATLDLVKNAEPVSPRHLQPGVATDLETICLKCLRKEPHQRYESAEALAEDLSRYLNGEPILARPTPRWERAWKWIRRRPSIAALVVVSTLSILAAAGGGLWYRADQDRQREAVHHRLEGVRTQVNRFILLGEEAIRRKDWDGAKAHMSSALALVRTEPPLADMGVTAVRLLAMSDRKIAEQESHDAARARFSAFQRSYDEAVFYQSQYTGLDPEANLRASRAAARRALEQFRAEQTARMAGSRSTPATSIPRRLGTITERYYELALILAEAISQPMAGEDRAGTGARSIGNPRPGSSGSGRRRRTFHVRRAGYLQRSGDRDGAEAEQRRANAAPSEHSAVDDFLEGEAAYRNRDYARAVPAFRRVLTRQPDHFWGQYLAGDLPSQGAAAGRGPGRADGLPVRAARLRVDLPSQGLRRGRDGRVRPRRGRLRAGGGAWPRRRGPLRHAGQPRRDADPPGTRRSRGGRLPDRDRPEARPVPGRTSTLPRPISTSIASTRRWRRSTARSPDARTRRSCIGPAPRSTGSGRKTRRRSTTWTARSRCRRPTIRLGPATTWSGR